MLCNAAMETEDHLFLDCIFSTGIWKGLILKLGLVRNLQPSWDEEIIWCVQNFSGSDCISLVKRLVLNGFIYHIWQERNQRVFKATSNSQDQVSLLMVQDVRMKLSAST